MYRKHKSTNTLLLTNHCYKECALAACFVVTLDWGISSTSSCSSEYIAQWAKAVALCAIQRCRVAHRTTIVALATLWIWAMATLHIVQQKLWAQLCTDALLHIMPHKLHLGPLHGYITVVALPAIATNWLRMH